MGDETTWTASPFVSEIEPITEGDAELRALLDELAEDVEAEAPA